jgi:hypothetical protein
MEFIHNRDGFYCGVCVCGLGGVWLGQETCVALGKVLYKTKVSTPHKLWVFEMFSNGLVGQVCDWKNEFQKPGCIHNLCTYHVISVYTLLNQIFVFWS